MVLPMTHSINIRRMTSAIPHECFVLRVPPFAASIVLLADRADSHLDKSKTPLRRRSSEISCYRRVNLTLTNVSVKIRVVV